ncbi:putative oxidoreductase [Paenibacillus agaridevorans]|uniref:Putative oxidoreductase n=1 Tax=Paenibacillus agaridevorans TaxID=171404 RepID=A0A2R5F155_9BACL|nr:Gfo/Idh/MocA family oxidoreductase [Paenibacillus agaridevorans]GBG09424.1 putative oxidoreductase [Paenibacillus agaridevorans]
MSKVGGVGYGHQVKRLLGMMQEMDSDCGISAIADVRHQEIRERMKADGVDMSGISFFENADDMLNGGEFDGIFVGTQGLFVQKATHDFDYINHILGLKPITVCAMTSKQIFKGNKRAGMQCKDCEETSTCPESPDNLRRLAFEEPLGPYCCFAEDTGNEDSGSALIAYESSMHVSYSQNFFVRKKAAARGARFLGYKGTVEFDWATNRIQVYMHHTPRVESYEIDHAATAVGHGGGDATLLENFITIMQGKTQTSLSTLEDGLNSTLLCLKAKESAETGAFCQVRWPD